LGARARRRRRRGRDEATVKPRPDLTSADPGERCSSCARNSSPATALGTTVTRFWHGAFAQHEGAIEESYALLGTTPERLFPVTYRALVEHEGAKLEGTVTGFTHGALGSSATFELH